MFSEQQLSCIVQQITENYKNEDYFYIKMDSVCQTGTALYI